MGTMTKQFAKALAKYGMTPADLQTETAEADSPVVIQKTTAALTNAQIKALPTTPFTVVAAPGAGRVIVVVSAFAHADLPGNNYYTNIAYDENTPGTYATLSITYGDGAGVISKSLVNESVTFVQTLTQFLGVNGLDPEDRLVFLGPYPLGEYGGVPKHPEIISGSGGVVNQPVKLYCDNAGQGDFTGGNAANTLKVTVLYTVVDV